MGLQLLNCGSDFVKPGPLKPKKRGGYSDLGDVTNTTNALTIFRAIVPHNFTSVHHSLKVHSMVKMLDYRHITL